MKPIAPALLVVIAGVSAALHVGKLPPALPVLREALDISLVQAGFLLSLVQLAGMALGLAVGLAADGIGLKRCMLAGLVLLAVASGLGGLATAASALLVLRAIEGMGFLLVSMPAPSLIRRLVAPQQVNAMLGWWGAYMPLGTALALLCGPWLITVLGWPGWWWLLGLLSLAMAIWLAWAVPGDGEHLPDSRAEPWLRRLRQTLSARGPWLVAVTFAMYSGQWLAVVGFLPTIYAQAGVSGADMGVLTALAAAVNIVGNVSSGRMLQRGVPPQRLLYAGFLAMGMGAAGAFAPWDGMPPVGRYLSVLVFSMVGGMIPGTLFSLAVRLAPGERTVSTTVGWMQQWSAVGQFAGPPLVGWVASQSGGWEWTWLVTGACSLAGLLLASRVSGQLAPAR
ncbi:MAG: MFS transporter [Ramlibacter sp.]|nr:MFS transporter [Ramlibacter sp.]